jgi:MarR family transcriptional regulator, organic hydroperoxide resistance regulator
MAPLNAERRHKTDFQKPAAAVNERRRLQILRYSHIFASTVREILEIKFLAEVTPHSLTLAQFHLLKAIALNGNHQIGEVAVCLGMSPPAATKNLDKLQRLGLILRSPSKGDRRAILISPSAKGRRLVQEYEALKADRLSPVLENFSPGELDRMVELLKRFSLSLIKREDTGAGLCLWCAAYCQKHCPVGEVRGGCPYGEFRGAA